MGIMYPWFVLRMENNAGGVLYGAVFCGSVGHGTFSMEEGGKKNGTSLSSLYQPWVFVLRGAVKGGFMREKASITVEAALVCPVLCLVLCAMIGFTLELYEKTETYGQKLITKQEKELTSLELIRLEAVTEELY